MTQARRLVSFHACRNPPAQGGFFVVRSIALTRASYVFDRSIGKLVERDEYHARQMPPKRSDLPTPMVITDSMDALQHPCTGEFMTSKRAFSAVTRAHGCIEMGNDPARLRPRQKPKPDRKAIRDSLSKARARFNRGERITPK